MIQTNHGEDAQMTSRERILATFRGEPVDRFPVWLKMTNKTWCGGQPEDVRAMSDVELLSAAGCDRILYNGMRARLERPHVLESITRDGDVETTTWTTPDGDLVGRRHRDARTQSWHPTKYPVASAEDMRRLRWLFRDTEWTVAPVDVERATARQAECLALQAVTMEGVGPGPLMNLVEHHCGPENTVFLRFDERELFDEVLEIMHQDRLRMLRALLEVWQADTLWLTENTSTSLISPEMFREHCMGHLTEYANLIQDSSVWPVHHMCGTLNALLEDIEFLPAPINEAYTTRPLGDVSLAEGRRRMPGKCLLGGTNATLWMQPVEEIVSTVAADLAECPDRRRIFLTSAGVLPPIVDLGKARAVVAELKRL